MSILEAAVAYRVLTSRATLTGPDGLAGIDTHSINQGAMVLAAGAIYRLDRDSSTAPDGVTVIAPSLGPGRWIFVSGSGGAAAATVADLAALAALSTFSPDLVWVETLLCYWHRNAASTLAPDGITVVASIGGGNWERIVPTTAPDWLAQATWTIDPLLGDDENAGGALAPLASFDELNRRLSVGAIRQNTTATIVAGAMLPSIDLSVDSGEFSFSIVGTPTVVYTDTVATYTERVHATPVASQLTATGVVDWTPYVGMRLRITSGAATGAIAWIQRANPGGAGLNVARTSRMTGPPTTFGTATIFVPAPGSEFVLESLPSTIGLSVSLRNEKARVAPTEPGLLISSVETGGLVGSKFVVKTDTIAFITVDGCSVDAFISMPDLYSHGRTNIMRSKNGGPITGASGQMQGKFTLKYGLSVTRMLKLDNGTWQLTSHLVAGSPSEGIILSGGTSDHLCSLILQDAQIFDCAQEGIAFWNTGNLKTRSGLSGNGNLIGMVIGDPDNEANCGQFFVWDQTSSKPNLLGTTATIRIAGSTNIDLTWSQVPFASDEQIGIGTLINGTATIAARNANLRPPTATHATLAGTAVGTLSIPTATLTSSQFVVNSVNAAGALVDDDSTFRWHIPAMSRKVVICQGNSIS